MAPARIEQDKPFDTFIHSVPITEKRKPFVQISEPIGQYTLDQPGTARANIAASVEHPHGTERLDWAERHKDQTVLQQHVEFFDTDKDGVIWPHDTFRGFYRLGFGIILSLVSVIIINVNFSYPTIPPGRGIFSYIPDPFFRVWTARIHKDKHGSDSGTFDPEGRFIPQKFEDIFAKYGDEDGITFWQVVEYLKGQRVVFDPFGWGGAVFEWLATYILLWPADGKMKKDDIRRIYDGSLFYEIASRRSKEKA